MTPARRTVLALLAVSGTAIAAWWSSSDGRSPGGAPAMAGPSAAALAQSKPPAAGEAEQDCRNGNLAIVRKDYDLALSYFDHALRVRPDHVDAVRGRMNANFELGRFRESLQDCDRLLAVASPIDGTLYKRGEIHLRLGEYEPAVRDLTEALRGLSDFLRNLRSSIAGDRTLGQDDDIAGCLSKGERLEASIRSARANVYFWLADYDRGTADATEAIRLDPDKADPYFTRAYSHFMRHRWDMAMGDFQAAILRGCDRADAMGMLAVCLCDARRFKEALEWGQRAVSKDRNCHSGYFALSLVYGAAGNATLAEQYLRQAKAAEAAAQQQAARSRHQ